jgi:Putative zinc- or iron-chelating domain
MSKVMGSSPTTYARRLKRYFEDLMAGKDYESNPPCWDCTACCRSGFNISFTPNADEGREHLFVNGTLPKNEDDSCSYLINGECTVYAERPSVCRRYDCRSLAFAQVTSKYPLVAEAVAKWDVEGSLRTHDDRKLLDLIPIEAKAMVQRGDHIRDRLKLVALTNRAIVVAGLKVNG